MLDIANGINGQSNMVDQGGWLDEVLWIVNTDDAGDLQYLQTILSSNPNRYKAINFTANNLQTYSYYKAWQHIERGKYYVKIDDDIVWIEDEAIPQLVTRKITHPDEFVVSANVINNPPLGFLHYHFGALHPYFPEVEHPRHKTESWRPSMQPFWVGPEDFTWPLDRDPPHPSHRWLRVEDDSALPQTPAGQLKYEIWGESYNSWAIAAQMHYSLLENIERGALDLYKFRQPWYMDGRRIRINFICIYADDILDTDISSWPPDRGDEDMIVIDLPKRLRRREYIFLRWNASTDSTYVPAVTVIGNALGSHFQYSGQPGLEKTDILGRYQALAKDRRPYLTQSSHTSDHRPR
ncbi:hypothetical protein VFPPC_11976 [Pochonia chlamydosporia 170]|uniref:Uncharacterized protein n=1 Tax=Pochonia chlamydosporia 170 TaxID=1380566 RepID=A0A179F0X7_METCM|nr:hypothetical protein VFPPC_11976 [Pochonia chlamydosporia 170]OAQ59058.1 hypothetical protein VFPPC_11976 [Pochonia chlamydosporia 170]